MKKRILFVGLTMTGTLLSSCVGDIFVWMFAPFF
jgi:hypothetical protein